MQAKIFSLTFVVILGGLLTQTMAAANQDFEGFSEWPSPVNLGPP